MKRLFPVLIAVLALSGLASGQKERMFTGHYRWDARDESGRLDVVFSATGEETWDVVFRFNFQGPHVYSGTAEGSLDEGPLTGEVSDEAGDRKFAFRGNFRKGKFRGSHFEVTGGSRRKTGTLSLRNESD